MKAILAVSEDFGIGLDDKLLFSDKIDQAFFAGYTMGKNCLVGYNTYHQVKNLPGRYIVLDEVFEVTFDQIPDDIIVIGGAKTYKKYANQTTEVLVTFFKGTPKANKFLNPYEVYPNLVNRKTVFKSKDFHIELWKS